jgi:hypothetical protein
MSEYNRDIVSLRQNDYDLAVQYRELLCLRAELARLLSRSNSSPRENRITRAAHSEAKSGARSVLATHPATEAGAPSNIGRRAGTSAKTFSLGTRGDAAKAREFYEKATVGGIQEAKDRLNALRQ